MKLYLIFISLFYALLLLTSDALLRPFMIDEGMSIQVAVQFFTRLQYAFYPDLSPYFGSFEPGMSIGIASTWPGGLGWIVGGSLFSARLFHAFYFLCLLALLSKSISTSFAKLEKLQSIDVLFFISIAGIASLKLIPNLTDIIIYGMGEYSGSLLWLCASILAIKHPRLSSLLLGIVVFHTKFILLPYCLVSLAFIPFFHKLSIKKASLCLSIFLAPLVFWMLLIYIRTGDGLWLWLQGRGFHLGSAKTGTGAEVIPITHLSIFERLTDSRFEWVGYTLSMKIKILILLLGGMFSALILALSKRIRQLYKEKTLAIKVFFLGLAFVFLLFNFWYFFLHAQMWLRHLMPTLIISFSTIAYLGFFIYFKNHLNAKALGSICFILSILLLKDSLRVYNEIKPLEIKQLYSFVCSKENTLSSVGPADIDYKKCGFNFPIEVNLGQPNKMRFNE